jgi:DNA-binding protein YbaB
VEETVFQDVRSRIEAVQREVQTVRVTVEDPEGLVRLTAGPGGAVEELEIADRAYRLSAEELAELVTRTMKEGTARAEERVRGIAADIMREGRK